MTPKKHNQNVKVEEFKMLYLCCTKIKKPRRKSRLNPFVPWGGIEPPLPKELDFESSASTNSATKAFGTHFQMRVQS